MDNLLITYIDRPSWCIVFVDYIILVNKSLSGDNYKL